MTKRLRVIPKDEAGENVERGFVETAQAALARALNEGALALTIVYEKPDGKVYLATVPDSLFLLRGLILGAHEAVFPDAGDDE